ncbi:MAG: RHS repeat-associated core domain-containing protein [Candidatus Omnitrophica bacterium]|nr:RHS repeat-associated core domain-containing protein [Candidatus Omnitrophota bacterium]
MVWGVRGLSKITGEDWSYISKLLRTLKLPEQVKEFLKENTYAYTPYGRLAASTGLEQPFKFAGQYGIMTEANGLYYMRACYYDPYVGRFISEDPSGFTDGPNLYTYVQNNPVNHIDPLGLVTDADSVDKLMGFSFQSGGGWEAGGAYSFDTIVGLDKETLTKGKSAYTGGQLSVGAGWGPFLTEAHQNISYTMGYSFGGK